MDPFPRVLGIRGCAHHLPSLILVSIHKPPCQKSECPREPSLFLSAPPCLTRPMDCLPSAVSKEGSSLVWTVSRAGLPVMEKVRVRTEQERRFWVPELLTPFSPLTSEFQRGYPHVREPMSSALQKKWNGIEMTSHVQLFRLQMALCSALRRPPVGCLPSEDSRLRMGNHAGKRDFSAEKGNKFQRPQNLADSHQLLLVNDKHQGLSQSHTISYSSEYGVQKDSETNRGEHEKKRNTRDLSREISEDSDVFGAADVVPNNGAPSQDTAVTDSKRTADPKNAWPEASPADPGGRPHLVRLFSRDAPGREDNTFKDRPSESDELQTIQEDSAAAPGAVDAMAAQKRPSQRSKYLASASTMDHARHGFLPRHRDTGILDSLGRFFGSDRGAPKRGSGKDGHHAARTTHYGSLPQKAQHGRPQDENPVVHFFKNIVTPRTPPPSQGKGRGLSLSRFSWGAEGQKPGFGYGGRASDYKSAHKGLKGHDAQGTLSKIFKLGGRDSRSGSPMARR
ncbi:hypothetical protein E5288_WYG009326 [Bos mutus]|uniref:Myelin basic protein n=2 Tax=Bos mutus TaxID=72004 RepID=A0A6B0S964_9CETA|nr:hypothetical protein [Bos mutus]